MADYFNSELPAPQSANYTDVLFSVTEDEDEAYAPFTAPVGLEGMNEEALDGLDTLYGGLATRALGDEYASERKDASNFRNAPSTWSRHASAPHVHYTEVTTRYFDEAERAESGVRFGEGGLLLDAQGQPIDTTQATGTGTYNTEGQGKHIFAMTPEREIRSVDPWAGRREVEIESGEEEAEDLDEDSQAAFDLRVEAYKTSTLSDSVNDVTAEPGANVGDEDRRLELVNHSSLVAGDRVAGAGELRVAHGKLQQVTDQSGHYRPDAAMTHNTLETFAKNGVDMRDVAVKYSKKPGLARPVIAPALEAMGYEGAEDTAQRIRAQRNAMADEIKQAAKARKRRAAAQPVVDPRSTRAPKPGTGRTQDLIALFENLY